MRGTEGFARRRGIDSDIVMPAGGRSTPPEPEKRGEAHERQADGLTPVVREETPQGGGPTVIGLDHDTNVVPGQGNTQDLKFARHIGEIDRGETGGESSPAPGHGALGGQEVRGDNDTSQEPESVSASRKSQIRQRYEAELDVFATGLLAIALAAGRGERVPPAQWDELKRSGAALDAIKPGSQALLRRVLANDPKANEALQTIRGKDRVQELLYAVAREEIRLKRRGQGAEPGVASDDARARAGRLLKSWQDLAGKQAQGSTRFGDRARLDRDMRRVAEAIRNDPQVEQILTEHARKSGLDLKGRTLSQEMERQILQRDWTRDRDRGMER